MVSFGSLVLPVCGSTETGCRVVFCLPATEDPTLPNIDDTEWGTGDVFLGLLDNIRFFGGTHIVVL